MDNSNAIPKGVSVGRYCLGRDQLFLILGPCVIESEDADIRCCGGSGSNRSCHGDSCFVQSIVRQS